MWLYRDASEVVGPSGGSQGRKTAGGIISTRTTYPYPQYPPSKPTCGASPSAPIVSSARNDSPHVILVQQGQPSRFARRVVESSIP